MRSRSVSQAYPGAGPGPRYGRRIAALAAAALVLGIGGYAAASVATYAQLSAPPDVCHEGDRANTPAGYVVPSGVDQALADANRMPAPEDVEFRPRDPKAADLVLRGWWIAAQRADAPAVIVVHGIQSCRREANVLIPAGMLHRAGYSVLLIDLRNHGDSDNDGRVTAGTTEHLDVLGAWDWLVARGIPATRIGIFAVSFGAATSIIAGAMEPRVAALWADSSWARVEDALRSFVEEQGVPGWLIPGGIVAGRLLTGTDVTARRQLDEITRYAGRPIAIVHGEADPSIACSHAQLLRDAAVAAGVDVREYWIVPAAGHTRGVYVQPAEYETRLLRFFGTTIGSEADAAGEEAAGAMAGVLGAP